MENDAYYLTDEEIKVLNDAVNNLNPGEIKEAKVLRIVDQKDNKLKVQAHLMTKEKLPTLKDLTFMLGINFSLVKGFVAKIYNTVLEEHKRLIEPEENLDYYTDENGYIYTKGPEDIKLYKYHGYDCFFGYNDAGEEIMYIKLGNGQIGTVINDGLIQVDGKFYIMNNDGSLEEAQNISYFSPKKR